MSEKTELLHDGSGPAATIDAPVGVGSTLADRFELVQLLGEGGMSRVFKAIDRRKVEAGARDPHIAVKVLTAQLPQANSLAIMHREAGKLQSLTHPNIVRVFDFDRDGKSVFMTMEHLDGVSLRRQMPKKGNSAALIPREEALRIINCIAEALDVAHRNYIVHGDLKPSNVIVTGSGDVKVIDFGISRFLGRAKEVDEPTEDWERDFSALTPPYASPQMHDGAEPDPRDDLYALASIAYELLVGDHPFDGAAANKARDARLPVPTSSRLREHEHRAIERALQFERKRRTSTARQFLDELCGEKVKAPASKIALIAGFGMLTLLAFGFGAYTLLKKNTPVVMVAPTEPLTEGAMFRDCPTCPVMRVLPPATFEQGSAAPGATSFEQPVRSVTIPYLLAAGVSEVTVSEFAEFDKEYPRNRSGCETYDGEWRSRESVSWRNAADRPDSSHPVTCVSWQDAADYAAWLSLRTGQAYRLPTSSEWEYLAGAGKRELPWSDTTGACSYANVADESATQRFPGWAGFNCSDRFIGVAPVGSFAPNAFGLSDTLGNAFEWVQDCWRNDYTAAPTDGSALPVEEGCAEREARGGSWFTAPAFVRTAYRNRFAAEYRGNSLGFRLVREIVQ